MKLFAPAIGFALLAVMPFLLSSHQLSIMGVALIFAIFAMSLNLLVGYGGMASLGHSLYFGAGAYSVALLSVHLDADLITTFLAAIVSSAVLGAVVGKLIQKVRGTAYLMITLASAQVFWGLAMQWRDVTNGDDGLFGIASPEIGGISIGATVPYYYVILVVLVLVFIGLRALVRSPFGYSLQGARESEFRTLAMGVSVNRVRYIAFIIASVLAGLAGFLFAYHENYVSPTVLSVTTSGTALLMVALGGGTVAGPLFGAIVVTFIQDFVGGFTDRSLIILGAVFVLVAIFLPKGLVGLAEGIRSMLTSRGRKRPDARIEAGVSETAADARIEVGVGEIAVGASEFREGETKND
jgi:branched-chain amino acid transport system permease protein